MALKRESFRNIVAGITTKEPQEPIQAPAAEPVATPRDLEPTTPMASGQGSEPAVKSGPAEEVKTEDHRRFAKRGRPKGRKDVTPVSKGPKVKVSLFLSEAIVNDLYDWAHEDRIHPGEMFERALKPFHEREAKRRNGGKAE
jgi:hypothetical protein